MAKKTSVEFVGEDGSTYKTYEAKDGSIRAKRVMCGWDDGDHEVAKAGAADIGQAVEQKHPTSKTTMPLLKGVDLSLSKKCFEDSVNCIMGSAWASIKDEVHLNGLVPVLDAVGVVVGVGAEEIGEDPDGKPVSKLKLKYICNRPANVHVDIEEVDGVKIGRVV